MSQAPNALRGPRLGPGDLVRVLAPAGPPLPEMVQRGVGILTAAELRVELGEHVFSRHGDRLAGTDEQRLADLNVALGDPEVRAVWAATGGNGSYRIVAGMDFDAVRRDPKPLIGFSDITFLHLALWKETRLAGLHGPMAAWDDEWMGPASADRLTAALTTDQPVRVAQDPDEPSAGVTIAGQARGVLLGGNIAALGATVGWTCPSFRDAILLLETANPTRLGVADMVLTQLHRSGLLEGLRGVAVGQITGFSEPEPGKWSLLDVLADQLGRFGVPVLGGLPIGHGANPPTVPLGTMAAIDTHTGTLTVEPAVL